MGCASFEVWEVQGRIQPCSDRVSTGLSWSWGLALARGCLIQRSGSWQDPGTAARWEAGMGSASSLWSVPGAGMHQELPGAAVGMEGYTGRGWFWSLCTRGNAWNLCECTSLNPGVLEWGDARTGTRSLVLECILKRCTGQPACTLPASVHRCLGFSKENHMPSKLLGGRGLVLPSALAREAAGRPLRAVTSR